MFVYLAALFHTTSFTSCGGTPYPFNISMVLIGLSMSYPRSPQLWGELIIRLSQKSYYTLLNTAISQSRRHISWLSSSSQNYFEDYKWGVRTNLSRLMEPLLVNKLSLTAESGALSE